MKSLSVFLAAAAGSFALFQWAQVLYRLWLFFGEYHGEHNVNHIGEGTFSLIYIANAVVLGFALFGLRVLWRSRPWRVCLATVGIINGLGWLTILIMHQTGMLVGYDEFIRHVKG